MTLAEVAEAAGMSRSAVVAASQRKGFPDPVESRGAPWPNRYARKDIEEWLTKRAGRRA